MSNLRVVPHEDLWAAVLIEGKSRTLVETFNSNAGAWRWVDQQTGEDRADSDRHDRISVISAITLSPQARRVGLHFMLLGNNENFHGEEVVLFLRQLKGEVGGPWTIVWDRNQIHSRARVVKQWLSKHHEVVVEEFPAHAPNTNPDEDVWCWTKYGQLCNLAPADVNELRAHIVDALVALKRQPQLLVSFILHARVPLLL